MDTQNKKSYIISVLRPYVEQVKLMYLRAHEHFREWVAHKLQDFSDYIEKEKTQLSHDIDTKTQTVETDVTNALDNASDEYAHKVDEVKDYVDRKVNEHINDKDNPHHTDLLEHVYCGYGVPSNSLGPHDEGVYLQLLSLGDDLKTSRTYSADISSPYHASLTTEEE